MMHRLGSVFLPVVQGDVDRQWRLRTDNRNLAFLGVEGLSYSGGVCVFPLIFTLHDQKLVETPPHSLPVLCLWQM